MRILALVILAIGTVSIRPAAAQTYDPAYPVCLYVYREGQPALRVAWTRQRGEAEEIPAECLAPFVTKEAKR